MSSQMVYSFGDGKADGNSKMKDLLGGKGANLAEMVNLGIPVPPGFTISTEVCAHYYDMGQKYPDGLKEQVASALQKMEKSLGREFGNAANPLLVSVRSGAAVSMPGMMDTVLNLGLNDSIVEALGRQTTPRFALDSYRRFIGMFSDVVMEIDEHLFEHKLAEQRAKAGVTVDSELTEVHLRELVAAYKEIYQREKGEPFPQDPKDQMWKAIGAVFGSWNSERAIIYRRMERIEGLKGTAVNLQAMVFGNWNDESGSGVCFTRDCAVGTNEIEGEILFNAQGEDVVAGIRTPLKISAFEERYPTIYKQLTDICTKLETHFRDTQDIEFTIQDKKLYLLQTRTAKRAAIAAIKIAMDMEKEGLIDERTAVQRVSADQIEMLMHPVIDPAASFKVLAKGLPAGPGAAVGKVVFSSEKAVAAARAGEKVILTRPATSPNDLAGMEAAQGILTSQGGSSSHAALVSRGKGWSCVVGCDAIDFSDDYFTVGTTRVNAGDWITIDGSTGNVILGQFPLRDPDLTGMFADFLAKSNTYRTMKVRANVDTPEDAEMARKQFHAEGIGLCRTEHMFFGEGRLDAMREMILAADLDSREKALAKLEPYQEKDFYGIFKAMSGLPVTIRLLDPPLHEFLPHDGADIAHLAKTSGVSEDRLHHRINALHEENPMLGHRGCRLAITYPEIYHMQVRAIIHAAIRLTKEGVSLVPEIMIPLVGAVEELRILRTELSKTCDELISAAGVSLKYQIGTMIEVPRATVIADEIAEQADFFSFGTNDLTQMFLGFSRDDVGTFIPEYVSRKIYPANPFDSIDVEGVGRMVKEGVSLGRKAKPGLKIGVCGEHGGDPYSVDFFFSVGLDYVSCSPFRIPVAMHAATLARLKRDPS